MIYGTPILASTNQDYQEPTHNNGHQQQNQLIEQPANYFTLQVHNQANNEPKRSR